MRLELLQAWFQPAAGALLPQLRSFLLAAGQAQAGPKARLLRWAITAAEPARGLRIEAVLVVGPLDGDGPPKGSGLGSVAGLGSGSISGLDALTDSELGSGSMWGLASAMTAGPAWSSASTLGAGLVSGSDSASEVSHPVPWRC